MCPLISKIATSYNINDSPIKTLHLHKDLGVMIGDDFNWEKHNDYILNKDVELSPIPLFHQLWSNYMSP